MVAVADLGELWGTLMAAWSGKTVAGYGTYPPTDWDPFAGIPSVAIVGGEIEYTCPGPGGDLVLTCPEPVNDASTISGALDLFTLPGWRSSCLCYPFLESPWPVWMYGARAILWTLLNVPATTFAVNYSSGGWVTLGTIQCYFYQRTLMIVYPPAVGGGLWTSPLEILADPQMLVCVAGAGFEALEPSLPNDEVYATGLFEWPIVDYATLSSPEALALRTLADSIVSAGTTPGSVRQQGGRPLLSVGGAPASVLPPWDGTVDTALTSLSIATQGFFSQGLVLPLRGGRRAVLGGGALL